ncbi:transcriptional regulator [Methanobrevibacter arboriphilus JCM 13429 = DSM 1125]|uniref:Transcriptional regulator n=1 Tax=Methanobrevibacter arboriphilus JCM 13429 = DSM 1125 TaxID=1300164 RepID=A0A1V6N5K9_METAZ|nr:metalloregulator ArsR/SmtB family transcription factor [Methanobrevibacter arboriphilus]OQD59883.1 transcriptional regulator [Methanobrevibacter arboriphilus JCM 13429 = DSM 1125]
MSNQGCEIKSIREDLIAEVTKKMSKDSTYHDISNLFKLLGDYNRIRILCALSYQELCVCELSLLLDMSQSAISHQLRLLRHKDIVKFRKENKQTFYSLQNDEIISIIRKANEYGF